MNESEFDKFAEEYKSLHAKNIKISGESPEFFAEYKIADVARIATRKAFPPDLKILDLGSGVGASLPIFRKYFPSSHIFSLDVSKKSLDVGRGRVGCDANFVLFDGARVPFEDSSFEIVFAACVFHHIEPELRHSILVEMRRILTPSGLCIIFEHNPLNPLSVRAVNTCPFDVNAELMSATALLEACSGAGFCKVKHTYRLFFPRFLSKLRIFEKYLGWLPLGAQYLVVGEK